MAEQHLEVIYRTIKKRVFILTRRLLNRHEACHKTKKCSYVLDKFYASAIKHDMLGNFDHLNTNVKETSVDR